MCKNCNEQEYVEKNKRAEKEAIERNLKIIGKGKNCNYRLYLFPCGHIEDKAVTSIRSNQYQCSQCFNEKLNNFLKKRGASLIGKGTSPRMKLILMPCGHIEEKDISNIYRSKSFLVCNTCIEERHHQEALDSGFKLLGKSEKGYPYKSYLRLECGHTDDYTPAHIRSGKIHCKLCLKERYEKEAIRCGFELLGDSELGTEYRKYKCLTCGTIHDYAPRHMANNNVRCGNCQNEKLKQEAFRKGLKLLGESKKGSAYRLYERIQCGHIFDCTTDQVRNDNVPCYECWLEKLKDESVNARIEFIKISNKNGFGWYKLPCCNKEQEISYDQVRTANVKCAYCDGYHLSNGLKVKSNLEVLVGNYLLTKNINFIYDMRLGNETQHKTDYYLQDINLYIEVAGGIGGGGIYKDYEKKLKNKHNLYYKDKLVLYIYPKDFKNKNWTSKLDNFIQNNLKHII